MALEIKFTVTLGSDCHSFIITDTTGNYNASTNPTGWGTPNPATSDVTRITLSVKNLYTNITYDNIVSLTYTDPVVVFPTSDLEIDGVSIGDVVMPDGLYEFTYTIVISGTTTYSATSNNILLCESCCKIKTLASELDLDCGCCNDPCADDIWKFLQVYTELKIIEYSGYCGGTANIFKKIKSLQLLLQSFNCKNC